MSVHFDAKCSHAMKFGGERALHPSSEMVIQYTLTADLVATIKMLAIACENGLVRLTLQFPL